MSLSSQSLGYGTEYKPTTTKINTRNPKIYTFKINNQDKYKKLQKLNLTKPN